ncbi:hypothetical protein EDB84DRAFT_1526916 [Lactarius hengduanensis]|nr:hypothetical protein EDB84DRAFT_1526916 [Lactarius hengduanensis]
MASTCGTPMLWISTACRALGPISTTPYTPRIPSGSNCHTFQSSALYNLVSVSTQSHPALDFFPHPSEGSRSRKCNSSRMTGTHTSSGSPASSASGSNGVTVILFSRILGVVFSVVFFA